MPCCGSRRMQATQSAVPRPLPDWSMKTVRYSHAFFQYLGTTGLTVVGAGTGTRYRFDSPGAVVPVDFRDQLSLQAVPHLRRVHAP